MSHGPLPVPKVVYRVIWPNGAPRVLSSGLSSAAPLVGKSAGGISGTSLTKDGLQLHVTRPVGTSGPASVGALLTGATFSLHHQYLFEATFTHAAGPTNPANYLWAVGLVLKDGNQDDLPADTRLNETLSFRKDGGGVDIARVNMPGFQSQSPPDTDPKINLAPGDYSRVTSASHPAIDFTLRLRLDFGDSSKGVDGTGDATVEVNQLPGLGGKSSAYLRHGKVNGPSQTVAYTTAGVVVVLARGDGMTASVILKEFTISQFK